MIRRLLLPLALVSGLAADASASVIRCWGEMREADCTPTTRTWPADSQPTFGVACEACWSTPDGGVCQSHEAQSRDLRLNVGGQSYGGEEHFELVGGCGQERLFRYKGPLQPGQSHELVYPGMVDYSRPLNYTVTFQVEAAALPPVGSPPPDASPGALPNANPGADAGPPLCDGGPVAAPASGGCSTAGRPHFPWAMAITGLALLVRRRRGR